MNLLLTACCTGFKTHHYSPVFLTMLSEKSRHIFIQYGFSRFQRLKEVAWNRPSQAPIKGNTFLDQSPGKSRRYGGFHFRDGGHRLQDTLSTRILERRIKTESGPDLYYGTQRNRLKEVSGRYTQNSRRHEWNTVKVRFSTAPKIDNDIMAQSVQLLLICLR